MSVGQLQEISRLRRKEKLHRLVQEAACEDAVAAYVDVAGFFFNVVKEDIKCKSN